MQKPKTITAQRDSGKNVTAKERRNPRRYTEEQLAETREKILQKGSREAKFNSKRCIEEGLLGKKYTDDQWTAIVREHFEAHDKMTDHLVKQGFVHVGPVHAGSGYFGAMQVLEDVKALRERDAKTETEERPSKPKPSK